MTREELRDKINWEGGIFSAVEYGILTKDVPPELRETWEQLLTAYTSFSSAASVIESELDIDGWMNA